MRMLTVKRQSDLTVYAAVVDDLDTVLPRIESGSCRCEAQ